MTLNATVCHLTTVHPAFDSRIFHRECKTLAKGDYDVTLVSQGEQKKIVDGVTLVPLTGGTKRLRRMVFLNCKVIKFVLKKRADLYHFHDPELIPTAILLKLLLRDTKVIYDVHEDYEKKIISKTWIKLELRKHISLLFGILEKFATKIFDYVITADSHLKKKFANGKTEIIANYPPRSFASDRKIEGANNPFKIVYSGRISIDRGVHVIVETMKYLNKDVFELHLCGRIDDDNLFEVFSAHENVKYHGELPWEDVGKLLIRAHVGLIMLQPVPGYLYYPGENITKLFEYMIAGLPVILSDFPKLKKLISEFKCGFAVDPTSPKSIADIVEYLYFNPDLRKKMGARGRSLVLEKYNWENESKKLLNIYDRVLNA